MEKFEKAFRLAHQLHHGQTRKGSDIPYISHLLCVSATVLDYGGNQEQAIAGLLHDTLEDCADKITAEELEEEFGEKVKTMVLMASDHVGGHKLPWKERKEKFLIQVASADAQAKLVIAADKLHNARSIRRDLRVDPSAVWDKFYPTKEETQWYYLEILKSLQTDWDHPILIELKEVVSSICHN